MKWRGNKFLRVMGELKPGVTPAMAEEDLTAILRRVPEEPRDVRVHLVPLKRGFGRKRPSAVVGYSWRGGAHSDGRLY